MPSPKRPAPRPAPVAPPREGGRPQRVVGSKERPSHEGETKVYGENACEALFLNRAADIIRAYVTEAQLKRFVPLLKWCAEQRKAYHVVTSTELDRIAAAVHHEGVLLVAKEAPRLDDRTLLARLTRHAGPVALLWLDAIGNPHNVGSLARVAAHFGVPYMIGEARYLPRISPSAGRVAEGAFEHVTLAELKDPGGTLDALRAMGFKLVATSSHQAKANANLLKTALPPRAIFVLGSEVQGVSARLLQVSDICVSIGGTGAVESLNVAVAGGLVLGEYWRQHGAT